MKIRSAEFLALVAIVTSATVLQIREHMPQDRSIHATQAASCGAMREGNGLLPAACEATRDATQREGATGRPTQVLHSNPKIWV